MGLQPIPEGYGVGGGKQGMCPETLKQMYNKKCLYLLCATLREESGW